VLLLHGWPQHWLMWRDVAAGLGGRYRLLMPDLRGFGWSQAPGTGYEPHSFAADARALLDALGLDRVRLVGHDWGGFTAFLLGVAHPERFERIVVFNAPPLWVPLSPRVIASLWRTWYVAAVACPLGPAIVASDRFVPRSYISGWQSHAPRMRAEFVPGCGHFLPQERPELTSSYLREFLP
jgi:pimeloyl-ACP methyl ester carboxylesterase